MESILADLFGLVCHQSPGRSPQLQGAVFPLCYRCAGLYLGILASYLYLAGSGGWRRRRLPEVKRVVFSSMLIAPFLLDGWANVLGLWSTAGPVRSLTGLAAGVVLPLLLVPLARAIDVPTAPSKSTLPHLGALIWPLALGALFVTMVVAPAVRVAFEGAALAAAAGLLLFLGSAGRAAGTLLRSGARGRGRLQAPPGPVRTHGAEVSGP